MLRVRFLIDDYQIDSQNSEELLKTIIGGELDKIVLTMATYYKTLHQQVQFCIVLEKNFDQNWSIKVKSQVYVKIIR